MFYLRFLIHNTLAAPEIKFETAPTNMWYQNPTSTCFVCVDFIQALPQYWSFYKLAVIYNIYKDTALPLHLNATVSINFFLERVRLFFT